MYVVVYCYEIITFFLVGDEYHLCCVPAPPPFLLLNARLVLDEKCAEAGCLQVDVVEFKIIHFKYSANICV